MNIDFHTDLQTAPRSAVVLRYLNYYIRNTATSIETYAENVREIYHKRVPNAAHRTVKFHATGDAMHDLPANRQLVDRFMTGAVRLPVDLEEAFVMAMDDRHRDACLAELAERYGLLPVPRPEAGGEVADLGALTKEIGEMFQALGPAMQDGVIDERDAHLAQDILREITDVEARLIAMRQRVIEIIPQKKPELKLAGE